MMSEEEKRARWTEGITKGTKTIMIIAFIVIVAAGGILVFYSIGGFPNSETGVSQNNVSSTLITTTTDNVSTTAYFTKYLGYIPSGYSLAPREPSAPVFPCPQGMGSAQCSLFQQTCGNGVCDPNERCNTCPLDCSVSGSMVCDPYTGRASAPASVCQITPQTPVAQAQTTTAG